MYCICSINNRVSCPLIMLFPYSWISCCNTRGDFHPKPYMDPLAVQADTINGYHFNPMSASPESAELLIHPCIIPFLVLLHCLFNRYITNNIRVIYRNEKGHLLLMKNIIFLCKPCIELIIP